MDEEGAYAQLFGSTPVTELQNELASNLDGALDPTSFLRILSVCDAAIFSGWRFLPGMLDGNIMTSMNHACAAITAVIGEVQKGKQMCIVFTGCGTSGRIAYLVARHMNNLLRKHNVTECFHYAIAGGDSALLLSDELPEDDPTIGRSDLKKIFDDHGKDGGYFIGITCGLSAPYVAGQWDYIISHHKKFAKESRYGGAVMGFNPLSLARNASIVGLENGTSFRDLLQNSLPVIHASCGNINTWSRLTTLTPVVGPEPIAGSSRMKGGSATLILLDVICASALSRALGTADMLSPFDRVLHYQTCRAHTYNQCSDSLPYVMSSCAFSLRSGGSVYYLGAGEAAAMGCIDLSEMPDTYGSPFDQMRGFVDGGWIALGNTTGDISYKSHLHRISIADFDTDILPRICSRDSVVIVDANRCLVSDKLAFVIQQCVTAGVTCHMIESENCLSRKKPDDSRSFSQYVNGGKVRVAFDGYSMEHIFSLKLILNAISTYSQASGRGAIYRGLMITTGPANDKIYHRCVRLISDIGKVSMRDAEDALLKSIYGIDEINAEIRAKPIVDHIKASILPEERRNEPQIVLPVALLLVTGHWSVSAARKMLLKEPNVSVHIDSVIARRTLATYAIGVDLGGSNIRAAIVDCTDGSVHKIVHRDLTNCDRSSSAILQKLCDIYDEMLAAQCNICGGGNCVASDSLVIGVGQPGEVLTDGSVANLANYEWSEPVPLRAALQKHTQRKVYVCADAQAALVAELQFGAGRGYERVVMMTVGTGIGTALSINGEQYVGSRGLIEGGHMVIDVNGALCPCGQRGCLEMYASGPALVRHAIRELQNSDCPSILRQYTTFTAKDVIEAANKRDHIAVTAATIAAKYIALGCINLARVYDPNVVILAGGLAHALFENVLSQYKELVWTLHDDLKSMSICLARCSDPGVVGAAVIATRLELQNVV